MVVVAAAVARERCAERCGSKFPPFFRFRPANRGKAARSRTETRNQYGMQMVGRKRGYRLGKQPGSRGGGGGIRKEFQLRARRFFNRREIGMPLVARERGRVVREIENEEFSWSDT